MKKLFVLTTIIAGTLFASSAYSQVYVNAHVGFRLPRVYVAPPPQVVYQDQYAAPAPVYQDGYSQDGYSQDGYAPAPVNVVYENEFPGYAYYNYPVWNGHFRDREYYEHYRPYFERDNRGYFDRGRFDHERFAHERYAHERFDHNRFEQNRGEHDRFDHDRGENRGYDRGNGHHGRW